jgi:site-specific DNA recombinase
MLMMSKKALIYTRVSSERQATEGHGLESQERRCRDYAENRFYSIAEVFQDRYSGGGDFMHRPAMKSLLEYADEHPFDEFVVIFDDLKRFARDTEFHLKLRTAFKMRGLTPECLNFNFDDSPSGKFIETILASAAELERSQNRIQVLQKMKARLENGYWTFNTKDIPGLKLQVSPQHGKLLVPKEPEASIIKAAFEGFVSGTLPTQVSVQKFLQDNDFKGGKTIHLEQVKRILTRILYAGYIEYPKWDVKRLKGKHRAIISIETFDRTQELLASTYRQPERRDISEDFVLRGFISCTLCEGKLTAAWSTSARGKKHAYYRCKSKGCPMNGKSIQKKKLEEDYGKLLKTLTPKKGVAGLAKAIATDVWKTKNQQKGVGTNTLSLKISKLKSDSDNLVEKIIKCKSEKVSAAFESKVESIAEEISILEEKLNKRISVTYDVGTAIEEVFDFIENPYSVWMDEDLQKKKLAVKLVFSGSINYDRENGFGTTDISPGIKLFQAIEANGSQDVEMAGVEPASELGRDRESTVCRIFFDLKQLTKE